jgi:hypothetical protein
MLYAKERFLGAVIPAKGQVMKFIISNKICSKVKSTKNYCASIASFRTQQWVIKIIDAASILEYLVISTNNKGRHVSVKSSKVWTLVLTRSHKELPFKKALPFTSTSIKETKYASAYTMMERPQIIW